VFAPGGGWAVSTRNERTAVSDRTSTFLRALCLAGLASLLIGARAHHMGAPRMQNASIAPGTQTAAPADTAGASRGAVAVVNDLIISDYDLNQRVALFMSTSGMHPTEDQMKHIREEVLRSLVDEMLELQEAQKNKVTVTKDEVDKALQGIAKQNGITIEQIEQMLKGTGIGISALRTQLTAQIAWQKLIQGQIAGRVQISDQDIDAAIKRLAEGAHKPQFLVSEIFLGVDKPSDEEKIRNGATQLTQQLNMGAPFSAAARQFSQSPSSAAGGDIGWVQQGQLAEDLDKALRALKPGETAGPIRVAGGYYILQLRERKEPAGTAVPKAQAAQTGLPSSPVPLARLLMVLPPKPSNDLKQRALQVAQEIRSHINGCSNLSQIAKRIQGVMYMNLGSMRASQLSPDLRNALANTQSGEVAQPFISSAGVEIIVRCDPKVEKLEAYNMPSRDEVHNMLFQEQMSMMARRYLRDLRRDAVIEYR
jgi:peptidyl-prolyl cis-trans isomerase SurA